MPMVSTMPAMPGRVRVAPKAASPAMSMVIVKTSMTSASSPASP